MKNLYLLGATGSIGQQVLEVIRGKTDFKIKSLSFHSNIALGRKIIAEFHPEYVSVGDLHNMLILKDEFPDVLFGYGEDGLMKAATYSNDGGYLVNAVVGSAGLKPTVAAIKKKRNVLLANKETLVMAGEIITRLVRASGVILLPIDSEHSAVFQCLKTGNNHEVARIILTASGGSLRNLSRDKLKKVGIKEALRHPNWQMGAKITIDSATMANKGLEVIEAHFLFGLGYEQIETVIHPESIVHSMVEFQDNSIMAQMSLPNMRIPIQYALYYPERVKNNFPQLRLETIQNLSFFPMNFERYPLLRMAYKAGRMNGIMPAVYNAANEAAVQLFLDGKISFLDIETIVETALNDIKNIENPSLEDILAVNKKVKGRILN
ncbi:MAG: 1-deoxy-D-xylulose-5-phosphate reductoisomerase [Bacilli bacterium]|nr:1-deoxy-D-xylulose-5-phosphate reductoisomerase [Bacilli bacterium]